MITSGDEVLHTPSGAPHWQESFYFNWTSREGRDFGLTRIGIAGTAVNAGLVTMHDGRLQTVYARLRGARADTAAGVRVGDLSYTPSEPLRQWRIRLTGRSELDLVWTAASAPYEFPHFDGAGMSFAQAHFEQVGRVEGTVSVDGTRRTFLGTGHRDKSWGPRDWGSIAGWEWISAQFGDGFAFNVTLMHGETGTMPGGFVWRDGEAVGLDTAEVEHTWAGRSHVPGSARLHLRDVRGREYEVNATAVGQFAGIKSQLFIQETPASFEARLDGSKLRGGGVVEHAWHISRMQMLGRIPQIAPFLARVAGVRR